MKPYLPWMLCVSSLGIWLVAAQTGSSAPQQPARVGSYVEHLSGTPGQQNDRAYSPAVISSGGKIVWLAGQAALVDSNGKSLAGDFDGQAKEVFAQIDKTMKRCGGSLQDVVTWTVYINDQRNGDRLVKIRHGMFPDGKFPGSALITVSNFAAPNRSSWKFRQSLLSRTSAISHVSVANNSKSGVYGHETSSSWVAICLRNRNRTVCSKRHIVFASPRPQVASAFSVQYLEGTQEEKDHAYSPAVITQGSKMIWLAGQSGEESPGNFQWAGKINFRPHARITLQLQRADLNNLVNLKIFIKADPGDGEDVS